RRLHHRRRKSQGHQDDPGRRASLGYRYLPAVTASAFASRRSEKPLDSRLPPGGDGLPRVLRPLGRSKRRGGCIWATDGTGAIALGGGGTTRTWALCTKARPPTRPPLPSKASAIPMAGGRRSIT